MLSGDADPRECRRREIHHHPALEDAHELARFLDSHLRIGGDQRGSVWMGHQFAANGKSSTWKIFRPFLRNSMVNLQC